MTPPRTDDNTLRMGFSVRVVGGNKSIHRRIGEQLDKQLKSFEACLKISKTEIVRVKARWKLSTGGIFEHVEILESVPDDKAVRKCFFKEINKLQLKKEKMELHGELEFATFIGTSADWSEQKRFEKGSTSK